jgi:uncharacterized Fe-S cluster protein YjdI
MARKLYTAAILDVSFDAELCQHAAECVRGMPEVFDTSKRPWINPQAAGSAELATQLRHVVGRCPSGALEIVEHPEHS